VAIREIQEGRVRHLNDEAVKDGDYVLYWMQQAQRAEYNHALEYAARKANELGQPLLVAFGLTDDYPSANARHYAFMLEALKDAQESLTRRRIKFVVQKGAPYEDVRRHRNLRKNWRMSPTRRSGASWAAQWLPRSNSLQETILAWSRSANLRMGRKS
jgi:deoxyribodipyrimidine photolyase